jgi:hypothetical protein
MRQKLERKKSNQKGIKQLKKEIQDFTWLKKPTE